MPLVVVCGHPCSGKSAAAAALASLLAAAGARAEVVDEPSLHLSRNDAYGSVVGEKNARAALKSEAERRVGREGAVLLDSLNAIKARAFGGGGGGGANPLFPSPPRAAKQRLAR